MILDDAKFEQIEQKVSDIQRAIDAGLFPASSFDPTNDETALRNARVELFKLREILRASIELEPTRGPDTPDAA